ncbi:unnamed protein product [Owenia fusiformis]|uniref:Uncharacterized protein n=1 Tax=Owenia fusiformis TaxID=6347 RepID=A0A8J1UPY4_OWEFU|nr:unnamed protein product [Owenia fusiformis]
MGVAKLEIPPELAFIFSKLDDWQPLHVERNVVNVIGNIPPQEYQFLLPKDINSYVFTKYSNTYFSRNVEFGMLKSPVKIPFLNQDTPSNREDAVALFSLILRFMNDANLSGKRELALAAYIVHMGISSEGLRDEIYVQLCNQTWGNDNPANCERGWWLMANCLSCFPPSSTSSKYLLKYISDQAYNGYKAYCQHKLLQCTDHKEGILARTYPINLLESRAARKRANMAVEVQFTDGEKGKAHCESWTTGEELTAHILRSRHVAQSSHGWTVALKDDRDIYELSGTDYVMDLIAELEQPPNFPCNKSYFLISRDKGYRETPGHKRPGTQHDPDKINIMELSDLGIKELDRPIPVPLPEAPSLDRGPSDEDNEFNVAIRNRHLRASEKERPTPKKAPPPPAPLSVPPALPPPRESPPLPKKEEFFANGTGDDLGPSRMNDRYRAEKDIALARNKLNQRYNELEETDGKPAKGGLNSRYTDKKGKVNDPDLSKNKLNERYNAKTNGHVPNGNVKSQMNRDRTFSLGSEGATSAPRDMDVWLDRVFDPVLDDENVNDLSDARSVERVLRGGGKGIPGVTSQPAGPMGLTVNTSLANGGMGVGGVLGAGVPLGPTDQIDTEGLNLKEKNVKNFYHTLDMERDKEILGVESEPKEPPSKSIIKKLIPKGKDPKLKSPEKSQDSKDSPNTKNEGPPVPPRNEEQGPIDNSYLTLLDPRASSTSEDSFMEKANAILEDYLQPVKTPDKTANPAVASAPSNATTTKDPDKRNSGYERPKLSKRELYDIKKKSQAHYDPNAVSYTALQPKIKEKTEPKDPVKGANNVTNVRVTPPTNKDVNKEQKVNNVKKEPEVKATQPKANIPKPIDDTSQMKSKLNDKKPVTQTQTQAKPATSKTPVSNDNNPVAQSQPKAPEVKPDKTKENAKESEPNEPRIIVKASTKFDEKIPKVSLKDRKALFLQTDAPKFPEPINQKKTKTTADENIYTPEPDKGTVIAHFEDPSFEPPPPLPVPTVPEIEPVATKVSIPTPVVSKSVTFGTPPLATPLVPVSKITTTGIKNVTPIEAQSISTTGVQTQLPFPVSNPQGQTPFPSAYGAFSTAPVVDPMAVAQQVAIQQAAAQQAAVQQAAAQQAAVQQAAAQQLAAQQAAQQLAAQQAAQQQAAQQLAAQQAAQQFTQQQTLTQINAQQQQTAQLQSQLQNQTLQNQILQQTIQTETLKQQLTSMQSPPPTKAPAPVVSPQASYAPQFNGLEEPPKFSYKKQVDRTKAPAKGEVDAGSQGGFGTLKGQFEKRQVDHPRQYVPPPPPPIVTNGDVPEKGVKFSESVQTISPVSPDPPKETKEIGTVAPKSLPPSPPSTPAPPPPPVPTMSSSKTSSENNDTHHLDAEERARTIKIGKFAWPPKQEVVEKEAVKVNKLLIDEAKVDTEIQKPATNQERHDRTMELIRSRSMDAKTAATALKELKKENKTPEIQHIDMKDRANKLEKLMANKTPTGSVKALPPPPPPPQPEPVVQATKATEEEQIYDTILPVTNIDDVAVTQVDPSMLENIQTELYGPNTAPYYMYNKTPWELLVRKEVFSPNEKLDNPLALTLTMCQIVMDVYEYPCIRLNREEKVKMRHLLESHNVTVENMTSSNHKGQTKRTVVELAKDFPLYFSRLFPINGGSKLSRPHMLAVSHAGIHLCKRDQEANEHTIKILQSHKFDKIIDVSVPKKHTVQIRLADDWLILYTNRAKQIKMMIEAYCIECEKETTYVRALKDYITRESTLLSFMKGDIIVLTNRDMYMDRGWLYGSLQGRTGAFPTEYVKPLARHELIRKESSLYKPPERPIIPVTTVAAIPEPVRERREEPPPEPQSSQFSPQEPLMIFHDDPVRVLDEGSVTSQSSSVMRDGKYSMMEFAMLHFRETMDSNRKRRSFGRKGKKTDSWSWKEQAELVKWTKSPIQISLLKHSNSKLNKMALECFISIMRYMGDYPLAKNQKLVDCVHAVLTACHYHADLRDEVYVQLCKQTTSNRSTKPFSCQRGWRLMSIMCAYYNTSDILRPYLMTYLENAAYNSSRQYHGLASVCLQNIRKTLKYGGRKNIPTSVEIDQVTVGRITKRQLIVLPGGTPFVMQSKSTTVVEDVVEAICQELHISNDIETEEYAIFYVVEKENLYCPLTRNEYIFDITTELMIQRKEFYLLFQRTSWFFPLRLEGSSDLYIDIIYNQCIPDYLDGLLLLIQEGGALTPEMTMDVARLAALQHRASGLNNLPTVKDVQSLLPAVIPDLPNMKPQQWVNIVHDKLEETTKFTPTGAKAAFLDILSKWSLYGSTFFALKAVGDARIPSRCLLAINKKGVHFLDIMSHAVQISYSFSDIISSRRFKSEAGVQFLDMKCGNLMMQKVTRIETDQGAEISSLIGQYIQLISKGRLPK